MLLNFRIVVTFSRGKVDENETGFTDVGNVFFFFFLNLTVSYIGVSSMKKFIKLIVVRLFLWVPCISGCCASSSTYCL